jgi:hypothetical protein
MSCHPSQAAEEPAGSGSGGRGQAVITIMGADPGALSVAVVGLLGSNARASTPATAITIAPCVSVTLTPDEYEVAARSRAACPA